MPPSAIQPDQCCHDPAAGGTQKRWGVGGVGGQGFARAASCISWLQHSVVAAWATLEVQPEPAAPIQAAPGGDMPLMLTLGPQAETLHPSPAEGLLSHIYRSAELQLSATLAIVRSAF
jgi:hypothetical protein